MAYIGKSPQGSGVRTRYYYTATGGETSISGADDNGRTLTFTDGEYVDVYLNGILLVAGTDYGTGTTNTINGLTALNASDIVEIVVYDIYSVAKINSEAIRYRYYKTASGGETSISGADDSGATITFPANAEIDVRVNGVSLVQGTDYNTTTANTVGGLTALTAGQVVEIVYFSSFLLSDTVSKASGGTFGGNVAMNGDLTVDTNTLYVDSTNNRVGIGTTSPSYKMSLEDSSNFAIHLLKTGSNDGWVRNIGTMDIAAASGGGGGQVITFSTGANYAGLAERMRVDGVGKLLINRTTALSNGYLAINGGAAEAMSIQGGSNDYIVSWHNTSGTLIGSITGSSGSSTSYNTTSDYRLKTAVTYDWDAITRLKQLRPARFEWIVDGDDAVPVDGFLAHELATVIPESVTGTHNEVDDEGNPVYQGVDQSKLTPLLTKALIEAVEKIEQLETRIAALENV
jgi:hypothetical protein